MAASFPESVKSFPTHTDGQGNIIYAQYLNDVYNEIEAMQTQLQRTLLLGYYANTETLSAAKTLTDADDPIQFLDPGGAGRDVNLPAEADTNHVFVIVNTSDANETLTVKDNGGSTILEIAQDESKMVVSDGMTWLALSGGGGTSSSLTTKGDLHTFTTTDARLGVGINGQRLTPDSSQATGLKWTDDLVGINLIIGDGTNVISTGIKGFIEVPYDMTITSVRLFADASGSIVIDIWKDTYANFPPTNADSITASAPPSLSSAQKSESSTFTGWTTSLNAGDVLAFNVDSAATVKQVTLSIRGKKA